MPPLLNKRQLAAFLDVYRRVGLLEAIKVRFPSDHVLKFLRQHQETAV